MAEAKKISETESPCSIACPCGTDVHGFMTALAKGGEGAALTPAQAIEEAFYIIADRNPIPAVIGRLCPHHCETRCSSEGQDGVPVNQVERAIAEAAINADWPLRTLDSAPGAVPVTVVGAGAAGLSAAYQLARRGYDVTLADPHAEAGGELRYGVSAAALPRPVLDAEVDRILAMGVTFVGKCDVDAAASQAPGRTIRTDVYEDGAPVPFERLAAAVQYGRHAAEMLHETLRGASGTDPAAPKAKQDDTGGSRRIDVTDARGLLSREDAIREAQRCLTCGGCVEK